MEIFQFKNSIRGCSELKVATKVDFVKKKQIYFGGAREQFNIFKSCTVIFELHRPKKAMRILLVIDESLFMSHSFYDS